MPALLAYRADGHARQTADAGDDSRVVAKDSVSVQLDELRHQPPNVVGRGWAILAAGELHLGPGRRRWRRGWAVWLGGIADLHGAAGVEQLQQRGQNTPQARSIDDAVELAVLQQEFRGVGAGRRWFAG